ncbi:MAG: CTP synthase [Patescibacteria group bacterium]
MDKLQANKTKYIFVTGGVLSGLGKGITAASLASLLKLRGLRVTIQKCDPYFNVDAGTLNPNEHGECFITDEGAETDLDLGHYERFLDQPMPNSSSLMSGRVYKKVIDDERAGKYLGKTVQIVPHVTNIIISEIIAAGQDSDVHFVEVGGTIGDYESMAFIEAIRELSIRVGRANHVFLHVVYVPFINTSKEFKTKPAQAAVRELRSLGINPEILAARSEHRPPQKIIEKLSLFCGVSPDAVTLLPDAETVYEVPLILERDGIANFVMSRLELKPRKANNTTWTSLLKKITTNFPKTVKVGIVAKYLDNDDTYISVVEALKSACWRKGVNLDLRWVNSEDLSSQSRARKILKVFDGIVVPGGFGARGIEGKICAAEFAIKNKQPYLGLCLGLQVAVIAQARMLGLKQANSTEFDKKTKVPVITTLDGQANKLETGGTMRLGSYPCILRKGSLARKIYKKPLIYERHRHRYEVNNIYRELLESGGLKMVGTSPDNSLVEIVEHTDHPFFLASQFHPEFLSRPFKPHPMFEGFISTLKNNLE